jgi:MFS family permease
MSQQSPISRLHAYFASPKGKRASLWLTFFLFWGGAAAVLPFISVYYESVNLSGSQIGQLNSIPLFISLISSVAFGFLADISKRNKLLLRFCVVGMIAVLFLFPQAQTFTAFLPLVLIYSIFQAPFNPILDETTLVAMENPEMYGKVRVGGSFGWGLMVLATGFLIDNLGIGIPVIFYISIAFLTLFFLITAFLPGTRTKQITPGSEVTLKKLGKMLLQPGFLLIFLLIIIWGMGESSIGNFLFLHIKHLGGSSTLMGIVLFIWLTGLSLIKDPNLIPIFQIFGGAGFALIQSGSVAYVNRRAPKELGTTAQALRGGVLSGLGTGIGALISGVLYEFSGSSAMFRTMSIVQLGGFILGVLIFLRDRRINSAPSAEKSLE